MPRRFAISEKALERQAFANANSSLRVSPITVPQKLARVFSDRIATHPVTPAAFEYPFSYMLEGDYTVADIMYEPVHRVIDTPAHRAIDFPRTLTKYIWGSCTDYTWTLLGQLENGLYIFYEAGCSPLGFSIKHSTSPTPQRTPGASMRLVVADTLEYLVLHVLSDAQHSLYIRETIPATIYEDIIGSGVRCFF